MSFASLQELKDIENEMPWEQRERPSTMHQMILDTATAFPDRRALSYQLLSGPEDPAETLTWKELHGKICQTANLLRSLGIGEKDVVALVMPNCTETVLALLGSMVAGIANPINPLLEPDYIGAILRETHAKVVVTLKPFPKTDLAQKVAKAVEEAPEVHTIIEVDLNRYLNPPKSWIVPLVRPKNPASHSAKRIDFTSSVAKQSETLDFEDVQEDRVAAYFHTGGTTGLPKFVQHRYSGMIYNGWLAHRLLFEETDGIMCPLPLFHVLACHVLLMGSLKSGAHIVFPTPQGYRGDGVFDNFWRLCERWETTFIISVPTAISVLMQRKVDADLSKIKKIFSGSAPMPLELFNRFEAATGQEIIEGYGLTEVICLVSCNPPDGKKKVGSVGCPLPYTDVRIYGADESGNPVEAAPGEAGEICISNPGVYVGNTYTEASKNEGLYNDGKYLRTGDLGRIDEDGYLWITGRAKDLIIRGGHNIDPSDIEEALVGHPAVAMAAAIGQPDGHVGEMPCAYVELVEGQSANVEDLLEHCKSEIRERAAVPKHVEIMDVLPKTAVGKVFKPELRIAATRRVFEGVIENEGLAARIADVVDTKDRGIVVMLERLDGEDGEERIKEELGKFAVRWEWAG